MFLYILAFDLLVSLGLKWDSDISPWLALAVPVRGAHCDLGKWRDGCSKMSCWVSSYSLFSCVLNAELLLHREYNRFPFCLIVPIEVPLPSFKPTFPQLLLKGSYKFSVSAQIPQAQADILKHSKGKKTKKLFFSQVLLPWRGTIQ